MKKYRGNLFKQMSRISSIFFVNFLLVFSPLSGVATAARVVNTITVNGGSSVTVAGGASVNVSAGVTTTLSGIANTDDWVSTSYTIGADAPVCIDTPDHLSAGVYNESFSITSPSVTGVYDLRVDAFRDPLCAGPTNNPLTLVSAITVDATAPATPTHVSPADNSYLTTAALDKIDWSDESDSSSPVTYQFQSSTSSSTNLDGSFTSPAYTSGPLSDSEIPTAGTPENTYYWHVRATDNLGNTSPWSSDWTVTVDNTAPSAPVASPVAGTYNAAQNVTLSATGSDSIRYSTSSTPANCTSGTLYSGAISVASSQTIYALACDIATNTSNASFAYVIDTTPPSTPVASPIAGTYNATQNVTITATGSDFLRYSTSSAPANCTADTLYSGALSVSLSQILYALACDNAGNTSSASFAYIIDATNPTVDAGDDQTENAEFTQVGSSTDPGGSGIASRLWTKTSGPGTVTFGSATFDTTTVTASADGTYVIRLTATDNAGNSFYDQFTLVWNTSANDNDNDGYTNANEDGAPNSGDGNNDGTPDKDQANVTSFFNTIAGSYAVLESSPCSLNEAVSVSPESVLFADPNFSYPFGIMNFTLTCWEESEGPVTATITQYFYGTYNASTVVARKYNPTTHAYTTIPGAVLSNVTIGGLPALKIVYQVTDGSSLDQDGLVNGTIVDPAGPAVRVSTPAVLAAVTTSTSAVKAAVSAPNTGIQRQATLMPLALLVLALGLSTTTTSYGKKETTKK